LDISYGELLYTHVINYASVFLIFHLDIFLISPEKEINKCLPVKHIYLNIETTKKAAGSSRGF